MNRYRNRSLGWVFVTRMIGIISFLIIIVLANILTFYVANPYFHSGVAFLNQNFWLLILILVIMFIGSLFMAFPFPLNLPGPIINAIGSVFCIVLVLNVFQWVDAIAATHLYQIFLFLAFLIVPVIFLIVLLTGYYDIMRKLWLQSKPEGDADVGIFEQKPPVPEEKIPDAKSWDEIGAEFRLMLYDTIHRFRQEINRK